MTVAPESPTLRFDDIHGAVAALRERGLRLSAARRQVLETLFALDAPRGARARGHRPARPPRTRPRALRARRRARAEYLVCERCGRLEALAPVRLAQVRAIVAAEFGYVVSFAHFPMVGRCAACSAAGVEDRQPPAHAS